MRFIDDSDKMIFDEIVRYLDVLIKIDFLNHEKEVLNNSVKQFSYYGNDRKNINDLTLGKSKEEYISTKGYKLINENTICFDIESVQLKPLKDRKEFKSSRVGFGSFYKEYGGWMILFAFLFSIGIYIGIVLGMNGIINENYGVIYHVLNVLSINSLHYGDGGWSTFILYNFLLIMPIFVFLSSLLISFLIVMVPWSILWLVKQKCDIAKENKNIKKYNEKIDSENRIILSKREKEREELFFIKQKEEIVFLKKYATMFQTNMAKLRDLLEAVKIIDQEISSLKIKEQNFLKQGKLHSKYKTNLPALICMVEYFITGRCTTFIGSGGAIDVYEKEIYQNQVLGSLNTLNDNLVALSDKLDQVTNNQMLIGRTMGFLSEQIQVTRDVVAESLTNMEYKMGEISKSIKEIPSPSLSGTIYDSTGHVCGSIE